MQKAYLILENGRIFEGRSFGAVGTNSGELVFNTGMTGLAESLTDPRNFGQIVIYTFPEIGNYGIAYEDCESDKCHLCGVVARNYTKTPSNFRCEISVDEYLKQQNVIGICGVDTRELTQILRDNGTMKAVITTEDPEAKYFELKEEAVPSVSCEKAYTAPTQDEKFKVALYDFGVRRSTVKKLCSEGCTVTVLPYNTPADVVLNGEYDGVVLSEGPGDPTANEAVIGEIAKIIGKVPVLGLGLGHQVLALAAGGNVVKLKFGHRGANQPVKDFNSGRVLVTSQNHGYAVDTECAAKIGAVVEFANVNDGSCEGLLYPEKKAVSVQFEHAAVFERFTSMMGGK